MTLLHPTLHTAALAGLEQLVNRSLALDPATRQRLTALDGKVLAFHCTRPALSLYLRIDDQRVLLMGAFEGEADSALSGRAEDFSALLQARDPASALINGGLLLRGDSQPLIELQKILRQLDLDWEAPLAEAFGDVLGHQLGRGLRRGARFGQALLQSLHRQASEYLVEESEWLAPHWQVQRFYDEVDQLSERTDRLQARVSQLQLRLQQRAV